MPDYTYLRQGNMPPSPQEVRDSFEKLFILKREEIISELIAESKDHIERSVSSFCRNRMSCYGTHITSPTWLNKSYRLCDELLYSCILYSNGQEVEVKVNYSSTYGGIYFAFPSKKDLISVIEECNTRLRDAKIVLGLRRHSKTWYKSTLKYWGITIDADLGIL